MSSRDDSNRIEKQAHRYDGYEAQDQKGDSVGHVDDLFVDTVNGQEYVELNMGALGLRSTIVPLEICTVDEEHKVVVIPMSRTKLRRAPRKRAPLLGDEVMAITPEYEDRIREYFGLEPEGPSTEERPFRAFSTAYSSGEETSRGEVRPVEARRIDSGPAEPEVVQAQEPDEPEATEVRPVDVRPVEVRAVDSGPVEPEAVRPKETEPMRAEPRSVEPDVIEAQDAEAVEPEVVGPQDTETVEAENVELTEVEEPQATEPVTAEDEAAAEPEAAEPVVAENEMSRPSVVEPEVLESEGTATDGLSRSEVDLQASTAETEAVDTSVSDESGPAEEAGEPVEVATATTELDDVAPVEDEAPRVAATVRAGEVEAAGQQMTEAAHLSLQALADRAVTAQEGNLALSRGMAQTFVEQLQSQTQGNQQAITSLQEEGQRQQQALQTIVQGSVNAYTNLLSSTFSLYQQTLQSATRFALGNFQAAATLAPQVPMVLSAGAQRGAEAVQQGAETTAGQELSRSQEDEQEILPRTAGPETMRQNAEEADKSTVREVNEESAKPAGEPVGQSNKPAEAVREETEPTGGSMQRETGDVQEPPTENAEEAEPAGFSNLLPPPPVVPNILDQLPPAPQVAPMEETRSEESSEKKNKP